MTTGSVIVGSAEAGVIVCRPEPIAKAIVSSVPTDGVRVEDRLAERPGSGVGGRGDGERGGGRQAGGEERDGDERGPQHGSLLLGPRSPEVDRVIRERGEAR